MLPFPAHIMPGQHILIRIVAVASFLMPRLPHRRWTRAAGVPRRYVIAAAKAHIPVAVAFIWVWLGPPTCVLVHPSPPLSWMGISGLWYERCCVLLLSFLAFDSLGVVDLVVVCV